MRLSIERKYQTQIHRRRDNFQYLIFFRDNGVKDVFTRISFNSVQKIREFQSFENQDFVNGL